MPLSDADHQGSAGRFCGELRKSLGRPCLWAGLLSLGLWIPAGQAPAAIVGDAMGDTQRESVYHRNGELTLANFFHSYIDPLTGLPMPIVDTTGRDLIVGDVSIGEDPQASDQLTNQRFLVSDESVTLSIQLLGGMASYHNIFGFYTYQADENPQTADLELIPAFQLHEHPAGSMAEFTFEPGTYVGFYLATPTGKIYYSENARNADTPPNGLPTDHFLMFQTNAGLVMAMEDLDYVPSTGRLGDQDYQDMIVRVQTVQTTPADDEDGSPVPEPGTLAVLSALGLLGLAFRH
ncbi:MAG: DUF4114 domain-containing protein [Phycisphaeraceae bacterium]|nr:DUF4114 domain-containing protein [Phycisphaeraceae bacterium]